MNEEQRRSLIAILLDHKECLERPDFPICGRAIVEALERAELNTAGISADEIDSKASLIWEIDGLVEKLEKGELG